MNPKHQGALSELAACSWLLREGYEVFRNVSQAGLIDIIAIKDGKFLKLDVKTKSREDFPAVSKEQLEAGVGAIYVLPDGSCIIEETPRAKRPAVAICEICHAQFIKRVPKQRRCSKFCEPETQLATVEGHANGSQRKGRHSWSLTTRRSARPS